MSEDAKAAAQPDDAVARVREIVAAAEGVLTRTLGAAVHLGHGDRLGGTRVRSTVLRCPVELAPAGAPRSVVVKSVCGDPATTPGTGEPGEGEPYDPTDSRPGRPAWRLLNEWAAARFLAGITPDDAPPLAARLYGADRRRGIVVLEDLGDGPCLADLLQGDDPARAEAGLFAYARALGRLHARTTGREVEYEAVRRDIGAPPGNGGPRLGTWQEEDLPRFVAAATDVGVPPSADAVAEIAAVAAGLNAPDPFLAFQPGDTCPDNHRFAGDLLAGDAGSAGSAASVGLRLFDFEFAGFRHALLDAVYLLAPFPSCWCVNRLPAALPPRLLVAYREALAAGCPAAADDVAFEEGLLTAWAYWTLTTLAWNLADAVEADRPWGISSLRPRHLLRLDTFAAAAERTGRLPALGAMARTLAERLRAAWPATPEMPLYPPFR